MSKDTINQYSVVHSLYPRGELVKNADFLDPTPNLLN